jgi:hypothetical protein
MSPRRVAAVIVALVTVITSAAGAATPADLCEAGKLRGAAHGAYKALKCHSKAARAGIAADPTCLAKADGVIVRDFGAAEAKGGCPTTGDVSVYQAEVTDQVDDLVALLRPALTASRCTSGKLKAVAKEFFKLARAHVKFQLGGDLGRFERESMQAHGQVVQGFVKVEARGDCLTMGDGPAADAAVTADVERLRGMTHPVCGDDVRAGGEECDGSDAAACTLDCGAPSDPLACQCCAPAISGCAVPSDCCSGSCTAGACD